MHLELAGALAENLPPFAGQFYFDVAAPALPFGRNGFRVNEVKTPREAAGGQIRPRHKCPHNRPPAHELAHGFPPGLADGLGLFAAAAAGKDDHIVIREHAATNLFRGDLSDRKILSPR